MELRSEPARTLALEHIGRRVESAPETLRTAARNVDLRRGSVEVLAGEPLATEVAHYSTPTAFESGIGVSSEPAYRQGRDALARYLRQDSRKILLMQSWDRPEAAAVRLSVVWVTIIEDEVWAIIDDALLDERYLRIAMGLWLDPYTGVAVLGQARQPVWEPGALHGIVSDVLSNIELILVGAFDGEGFLLWRRSPGPAEGL